MEWLTQSGIWIALAVAAYFIFRNAVHGGLFEGFGYGQHGGSMGSMPHGSATSNTAEATIDPVNGEPVRTDKALTSLYQGKIYYFVSGENPDRLEAAPQEYAQNAAGQTLIAAHVADHQTRRRHGC